MWVIKKGQWLASKDQPSIVWIVGSHSHGDTALTGGGGCNNKIFYMKHQRCSYWGSSFWMTGRHHLNDPQQCCRLCPIRKFHGICRQLLYLNNQNLAGAKTVAEVCTVPMAYCWLTGSSNSSRRYLVTQSFSLWDSKTASLLEWESAWAR